MKFSTLIEFSSFFYLGLNLKYYPGEEYFGLSIGRFYIGYYGPKSFPGYPHGWCCGFLDKRGCL